MATFLGLDCGGTRTTALLREGLEILFRGEGGPANLARHDPTGWQESIRQALDGCPSPTAVCGAFSGLLTESQQEQVHGFLRELFPSAEIFVVPDYEAALRACKGDVDVCVTAGTGSYVASYGTGGKIYGTGGKGYLLGDEGSAFQYGREAFLHFLESTEYEISPSLRQAIREVFGTEHPKTALMCLYQSPDPAFLLASLAPAFARDAEQGEIYALKALRIHPGKLAHLVSIHLREYHPEILRARVGCQGGLWKEPVFRKAFSEQLTFWCRVEEVVARFDLPPPVYGATLIAEERMQA